MVPSVVRHPASRSAASLRFVFTEPNHPPSRFAFIADSFLRSRPVVNTRPYRFGVASVIASLEGQAFFTHVDLVHRVAVRQGSVKNHHEPTTHSGHARERTGLANKMFRHPPCGVVQYHPSAVPF